MANPFDQFDATAAEDMAPQGANPFDQFDMEGTDMGRGASALQGFNSTIPFGNRITAGLGALGAAPFTDETISDLYNQARGNQKVTESAHPGANLAGSLSGLAVTLPGSLITGGQNTLPVVGKLADAAQKIGGSVGNFVRGGKVASDAGFLARTGKNLGTAARSALVAGSTGGLYGYGAGEEGHRLEAAKDSAVVGSVVGGGLPIAGMGLGLASNTVGGGLNRLGSILGNKKAQSNIADGILAKRLVAEGYTPEEIAKSISEARTSGLSPTLGEATGSSGVLQAEKSVLRGTGAGANQMREALFTRNRDTIPNTINNFADKLEGQAGDVSAAYKAASSEAGQNINTFIDKAPEIHSAADEYANLNDIANHLRTQINQKTDLLGKQTGFWKRRTINELANDAKDLNSINKQISVQHKLIGSIDNSQFNNAPESLIKTTNSLNNQIDKRLGELGDVSNVEAKALGQAKNIMGNAARRGNTFDALLDAKKQLDNLYLEGADTATQKNASRYVSQFSTQINDALKELAPEAYPKALTAAKTSMAAGDIREALSSTNEGSLATLYNKIWAKPELREDFLRKLPDEETRQQATNLFTQLENVKRGFGGSNTAFNLPANQQLSQEAGLGFNPNMANPLHSAQTLLEKIGGIAQPGVYKKLAEQSLNPDVESLTRAIQKVKGGTLIPNTTPFGAASAALNSGESRPLKIDINKGNSYVPDSSIPAAPASALEPRAENNQPQNDLFSRVIQQESGGDQRAISRKGAVGVAQILPATAKEAAADAGLPFDPIKFRTDANYNAALGKAYLSKLQNKYGNDALALMAYNWGQGNVDIWMRSGAKIDRIPAETKNYLQKILS